MDHSATSSADHYSDDLPRLAPNPQSQEPLEARYRSSRSRANISSACLACKRRKRRCLGGKPCPSCASSDLDCVYDETSDGRRKTFSRKAQAEIDFHKNVLRTLLDALRGEEADSVLQLIRSNASVEDVIAHLNPAEPSDASSLSDERSMQVLSSIHDSLEPARGSSAKKPASPHDSPEQRHSQLDVQTDGRPTAPPEGSDKSKITLPTFDELTANIAEPRWQGRGR